MTDDALKCAQCGAPCRFPVPYRYADHLMFGTCSPECFDALQVRRAVEFEAREREREKRIRRIFRRYGTHSM